MCGEGVEGGEGKGREREGRGRDRENGGRGGRGRDGWGVREKNGKRVLLK